MSKLDGLDIFVKVAELGNFSAAAEQLQVSKAHVSRQVSRLETRLGVQLFERSTRKVALTELGEAFYLRTRDNLQALEEAQRSVMDLQEMPQGNLRIAAAGLFAERHVAPAAASFMQRYPELNIELNFSDRMVDLIGEGFDLAIRSGMLKDSSLVARRITSRRIMLCASPAYLQQYGQPQCLEDLKQHNCLQGASASWHFKTAQGRNTEYKVQGNWNSNNGYAVLQAGLQGLGLLQLPEFYVQEAIDQQQLVCLLESFEPKDNGIWAVYPSNRHLSAKVRLFVEHLIEQCETP